MGLLEDIGNALGNAAGALANFIGDSFSGVVDFMGDQFKHMGEDAIRNVMLDLQDPESAIQTDSETIMDTAIGQQETAMRDTIKDLGAGHSEIPIAQAETELIEITDKIHTSMGIISIAAAGIEAASLGQFEGIFKVAETADRMSALTQLASSFAMMNYKAKWLVPYERLLNFRNPMKVPGTSDIVRFGLREVYDPARRSELLGERPGMEYYNQMLENGYNQYNSDSYWASHWTLPSVGLLNEMLHRGVIDDVTWDRFVKYNDFDPAVRPWLKAISYKPYTRVDVRRMYDVGVLDDSELLQSYKDLGYDDIRANNMALWTKVYIAVGELRARYSKGWITQAELKQSFIDLGMSETKAQTYTEKLVKSETDAAEGKNRDLTKADITRSVAKGLISQSDGIERLVELGYDEEEATFIIQNVVSEAVAEELAVDRDVSKTEIIEGVKLGIISRAESIPMIEKLGYTTDEANYILDLRVLPVHTARIIKERDLTKAELVKGVKKGVITDVQAVQMLEDMGYDNAEAWYIIDINVEALAGSPESWTEFQRIINRDRAARGQVVKPIPGEIATLETRIKPLEHTLAEAIEAEIPRKDIEAIKVVLNPIKRQHAEAVRRYRK